MYIDESYDMPGETLIRLTGCYLVPEQAGHMLAELIAVALSQTFQVCIDVSDARPSDWALLACFEGLRRIFPVEELQRCLWFYGAPHKIIEQCVPNARHAYQPPRRIDLETMKVSPIYIY